MAIDALSTTGLLKGGEPTSAETRAEIKRVAQEFEAMLMTQMLREMRRAMIDESESDGFGSNGLTETADVEFGRALSLQGGFGLAEQLLRSFESQIMGTDAAESPDAKSVKKAVLSAAGAAFKAAVSGVAGGSRGDVASLSGAVGSVDSVGSDVISAMAAAAGNGTNGRDLDAASIGETLMSSRAISPELASRVRSVATTVKAELEAAEERGDTAEMTMENLLRKVSDARISSPFGHRHDPFTGAVKFHKGIDVAMAYGGDVKAAAAGVVSFAGVQGGYGNTVVIDHGDGRQTRYAHLSELRVKAGDAVDESQVVAKSGNSGRSTGAHLHFEALVDGQPVDPSGVRTSRAKDL